MRILIDGQTLETADFYRGIGTYMRNVLPRLLKFSLSDQFYITLSDEKNLEKLDPWTRNRLHVVVSPDVAPTTDYSRTGRYTGAIQETVSKYHIDVLWDPNPLMDNVLFPDRSLSCKTFVMIHDVIPLLMPVKEWSEAVTNEYRRRLEMIRDDPDICLLFNSETSRKDWTRHLHDRSSLMRTTPLSADPRKFWCRRERTVSPNPYILFTGGFNYRKNIDGAIEAFRRARQLHADDSGFLAFRLIIVGSCPDQVKEKYERLLDEMQLRDHVEFTGFVSDAQLITLYQDADLFFFPSKYEGFGLPLLEAMLAGDYIVSADNSSLPEVCGPFATYFSVDDGDQIAEALYTGYRQRLQETAEDIRKRQEHAFSFNWDDTALRTLEFMEETVAAPSPVSKKPSLAVFTPWPDQRSGIARFEYMMMPYLTEYFDITVFTPAPESGRAALENVAVLSLDAYQGRRSQFDYRLFQLGNNDLYHKEIMDLFLLEGGIAEIHDYVLSPFFYAAYYASGEKKTYRRLLRMACGRKAGDQLYHNAVKHQVFPDMLEYPLSEAVVNLSDKAIFHNQWSADRIPSGNVAVIPLPSFPLPVQPGKAEGSAPLELVRRWREEGNVIISCFGYVNENKHPEVSLQALSRLRKDGLPVKLVFWGISNIDTFLETVEENGVADDVLLSGYLDEDGYNQAFAETDIVVNLRHPSMGESSGPLCEAFRSGKAVIVSDLNQYREFPDDICWKLPVGNKESEILAAYLYYLVAHPEVRLTLGRNAKAYADYVLSPARIARQYYDFIAKSR